jgi:hypothetical protein
MATSAHGTILRRNGVAVADLGDLTAPALQRKTVDQTRHCDTDDFYALSPRFAGPMEFKVPLSVAEAFVTAWANVTTDAYDLVFPDGATWSFSGLVLDLGPTAHIDDELMAQVVIQPTGLITLVASANVLLLEDGSGSYLTEAGDDFVVE